MSDDSRSRDQYSGPQGTEPSVYHGLFFCQWRSVQHKYGIYVKRKGQPLTYSRPLPTIQHVRYVLENLGISLDYVTVDALGMMGQVVRSEYGDPIVVCDKVRSAIGFATPDGRKLTGTFQQYPEHPDWKKKWAENPKIAPGMVLSVSSPLHFSRAVDDPSIVPALLECLAIFDEETGCSYQSTFGYRVLALQDWLAKAIEAKTSGHRKCPQLPSELWISSRTLDRGLTELERAERATAESPTRPSIDHRGHQAAVTAVDPSTQPHPPHEQAQAEQTAGNDLTPDPASPGTSPGRSPLKPRGPELEL